MIDISLDKCAGELILSFRNRDTKSSEITIAVVCSFENWSSRLKQYIADQLDTFINESIEKAGVMLVVIVKFSENKNNDLIPLCEKLIMAAYRNSSNHLLPANESLRIAVSYCVNVVLMAVATTEAKEMIKRLEAIAVHPTYINIFKMKRMFDLEFERFRK